MSFVLTCPNCGAREVTDFGYGGEVTFRPRARPEARELNAYAYFRRNVAGPPARDRPVSELAAAAVSH
jgi:sarcosine oxidase delta subunit